MVTPQQRGQVVVKSIGDIQRETTVHARKARPASAPKSNLGHSAYVPPMIAGLGLLNKYWKLAQHPAHTMLAGMFVTNGTPVSLSKVRTFGGKTGAVTKMVLYTHLGITVGATVWSTYRSLRK
jgi:hypothetical protein